MGKRLKMNLKTCLFGMLLVLLTGWFLKPITASALIGMVMSVNAEVTAPVAGFTPQTDLPKSGTGYRFTEIKWYEMSGATLREFTGTFQEGKRYIATVTVKPDAEVILATGDELTATINGHAARRSGDFSSEGGTISYIFPATKGTLAVGDGWYIDSDGCLHIFGKVTTITLEEGSNSSPWRDYRKDILSVVTEPGASITNCEAIFNLCTNLVTVDLRNLDTTGVTSMAHMFNSCSNLTQVIGLESLNTKDVTKATYMFVYCNKLESFNFSSFHTEQLTDVKGMVYACKSLREVDLRGWSVPDSCNVENMLTRNDLLTTVKINSDMLGRVADQLMTISKRWENTATGVVCTSAEELKKLTGTVTLKRNEPIIIEQPSAVTAKVGEKVTFSVSAVGEGLTYQWQYRNVGASDWSNSGAAAAKTPNMTFTVGTDKSLDFRSYRCVITDKNGVTVTSQVARLTTGTGFAITSQPIDQTAAVGETVSFKVEAIGEGLTYQWQYMDASTPLGFTSWSNSGAAAAKTPNMTFKVGTDKSLDGRKYRCVVTNKHGYVLRSDAATLTVGTPAATLAITSQPANQTAAVGEKVTFSVKATGEGLTYQWQYKNATAANWSNSGAAAAKTANMTFTVGTDKTLNGRQYRCIIKDKDGNEAISEAATLTVGVALAITSQPTNQTAAVGEKATFSVTATGEGLTYQWQYKSASASTWTSSGVAAAKTANMTFTVTDKNLNGRQYRCIVTDKNGATVTSNAATLTVGTAAASLAITSQPVDQTAAVGEKVTFSVTATGEGLTYQWQYKNANATAWSNSGAAVAKTANMTFTVGADKTLNGRQYRCVVKDKNGNEVISNAATLTVK